MTLKHNENRNGSDPGKRETDLEVIKIGCDEDGCETVRLAPMDEVETGLTFPCEMPMKIIGENIPETVVDVLSAFNDNGVVVSEAELKKVPSSAGKYVSLNYTFTAQSREQVDAIYMALTSNPRIRWVL